MWDRLAERLPTFVGVVSGSSLICMGSNKGLNEVLVAAGRPVVKNNAGDDELGWISWRGRDGEELFPSWSEMECLFFCEGEGVLV